MHGTSTTLGWQLTPQTLLCTTLALVSAISLFWGGWHSAEHAHGLFREVTDTGQPGLLILETPNQHTLWSSITPGSTHYWVVDTTLTTAEHGSFALTIATEGAPQSLSNFSGIIESCSTPYSETNDPVTQPECSGTPRVVLEHFELAVLGAQPQRIIDLPPLRANEPQHYRVAVSRTPDPAVAQSEVTQIRLGLGFYASGESTVPPSGPPLVGLAHTGSEYAPVAAATLGILGLAFSAFLFRKFRS